MIRRYKIEDKKELIALIKSHVPQYFDESEVNDFTDYLDEFVEDYFVVEEDKKIIGSGGINYNPDKKEAHFSWGMIHSDYQGKGIGRELTLHRINLVKNNPSIKLIMVMTSQLSYKFYQKIGFELEKIEKEYWGKGLDLYQMKLEN